MELREGEMERELGTDRRDVPHRYVEGEDPQSQNCVECDKSYNDARHQEWARVERASRQTAAEAAALPRING